MRVAPVLAVLAVLSLSACDSDRRPPVALSTAPVIAPGRPGEAARTLGASEAATAVPSPTANASDVRYVQDMIVHHRQALQMAILAPTRAGTEKVRSMASRIKDSQTPEIQFMTLWLTQQGLRPPDHHARHTDMPGMATPEQLKALAAASGQDFDRLFLQLMIAHHRGAITMSEQVLTSGSHLRIEELANEVATTQAGEIRRMFQLQTTP
ncbi:DUF305 domain-containing protein [Streptosporangium carneum]|uniref:Lipoprotein n=1 Tax=Streptosporangium carneum TaxID=47481 RepID=A0A9W6MBJ0_9ACTN|nr:DUF305 domain-containing protein [Streptosporangium carneum]GLK08379.1 lipoprotein [Streptosporangium carneum]